jgi:hypothetical protein
MAAAVLRNESINLKFTLKLITMHLISISKDLGLVLPIDLIHRKAKSFKFIILFYTIYLLIFCFIVFP